MGYKSKSILQIVKDIESSKMYLPALQRKFVWGKQQIELLFDSLMRNFPIGTFLFWNLDKEVANNYVFYEFLREYDQRNPYNKRKDGSFLNPEIIGVLDGQQRLSSMYIGLQGTHTEKAPYMRWNNDRAYRKSMLYLNLLSLPYVIDNEDNIELIDDKNFEFQFLTEHESIDWIERRVKRLDENGSEKAFEERMFWFKVGDVLTWKADPDFDKIISKFIDESKNKIVNGLIGDQGRVIKKALEILHKRITKDELINYFEIDKKDLEDILKIFIRVNSGGTQLNKTDLLFSTIVATWDDGRDEIESLLQRINKKGDGFNFSNEYLMRSCLVLTDAPVLYKVNSFKSENVKKIRDEWTQISSAIEKTIELLVEFGFSDNLLTSQNATIIIAYYIYRGGQINDQAKSEFKKYLIHALLTGIYGSSQDQLITVLRNAFRRNEKDANGKLTSHFSFDEMLKIELPSRKSLFITDVELGNFLNYKKGASSFLVLSLLYPHLRYNEVQFHQDHIHPASKFTEEAFLDFGLNEEDQKQWLEFRDMVPNLQLLEGRQNESKNATEFKVWLSQKNESEQNHFRVSNYIPDKVELEFKNFRNFFEKRKEKLKTELKRVLAVNNEMQMSERDFLEQETGTLEE
jgi:uncharacterized protein with ParB-like and HNH nuclease domain